MSNINNQIKNFIESFKDSLSNLDINKIESLAKQLINLRSSNGRLFLMGVGGSSGNCSHAVNDFRKLCKIQAFSPTDNVSEITARINDDGWENSYRDWLQDSNIDSNDALFVMSVGGGDLEKKVSVNLIKSIEFAKTKNTKVFSIVGREEGFAYKNSDISILVKSPKNLKTPTTESMQVVIWHILVSLKELMKIDTKW